MMRTTIQRSVWIWPVFSVLALPLIAVDGAEPGGVTPPRLPRYTFCARCFQDGRTMYSVCGLSVSARDDVDALDQLPLKVATFRQIRSKGPDFHDFSTFKITRMQMQPKIGAKWIELGDQALKDELREVPELPAEKDK